MSTEKRQRDQLAQLREILREGIDDHGAPLPPHALAELRADIEQVASKLEGRSTAAPQIRRLKPPYVPGARRTEPITADGPEDPRLRWVRTNRATGEPYTDARGDTSYERVAGPWHTEIDSFSMMTWCGKRPGKLLSSDLLLSDTPPADGHLCAECEQAKRNNRSRSARR